MTFQGHQGNSTVVLSTEDFLLMSNNDRILSYMVYMFIYIAARILHSLLSASFLTSRRSVSGWLQRPRIPIPVE